MGRTARLLRSERERNGVPPGHDSAAFCSTSRPGVVAFSYVYIAPDTHGHDNDHVVVLASVTLRTVGNT